VSPDRPIPVPLDQTMDGTLGTEIVEESDGLVRGRMPVKNHIRQGFGLVHGGAMLTLAESLASVGTYQSVRGEGKAAMGQEINASLMRSITSGHVNATARVRKRGRSAWIWEVEITDDEGRLCSLVRMTIAVR
jgi:1,4-dihydroxy-2-naphthoyl-CoA hydrolase